MHFRLIVGLGNPGTEYRETRHNVGFMVLERLAKQAGVSFRKEKSWGAEIAQAPGVIFCKPLTYMNRSGEVVRAVSDFYKINPEAILVIYDDMALPLGKIRLRAGGSAGGHNGVRSMIERLGTQDIARLRVGIGAADRGEATSHVLGRFAPEETDSLKESLDRALLAVESAQKQGFEAAMNAYN